MRSHLDEPRVDYDRRFLAQIQRNPEVGVLPCHPETNGLCLSEDPGMQGGMRRAEAARAAASTRMHKHTCATIVHFSVAPFFRFIFRWGRQRTYIFRTCSDPVLVFWYFSGAGGQNLRKSGIHDQRFDGQSFPLMYCTRGGSRRLILKICPQWSEI